MSKKKDDKIDEIEILQGQLLVLQNQITTLTGTLTQVKALSEQTLSKTKRIEELVLQTKIEVTN